LTLSIRHLAPGGYIEVGDPLSPLVSDDGTVDNTAVLEWNTLLLEASVKLGAPMDTAKDAKQRLIEAGFQNVVQVEYKWPTNPWPKDAKHKELGKKEIPFLLFLFLTATTINTALSACPLP
jgi:hypothetical protein